MFNSNINSPTSTVISFDRQHQTFQNSTFQEPNNNLFPGGARTLGNAMSDPWDFTLRQRMPVVQTDRIYQFYSNNNLTEEEIKTVFQNQVNNLESETDQNTFVWNIQEAMNIQNSNLESTSYVSNEAFWGQASLQSELPTIINYTRFLHRGIQMINFNPEVFNRINAYWGANTNNNQGHNFLHFSDIDQSLHYFFTLMP